MNPPPGARVDTDVDHAALAEALLGRDPDPSAHALRTAGVYAALFVEDPLLHSWAGLASFVALQLYRFLDNTAFEPLARGNHAVYTSVIPNLLRFRDGVEVDAAFAEPFARMRDADHRAHHDLDGAFHLVARAVDGLSELEQRHVLQPIYDEFGDAASRLLSRVYLFRIGWDTAAPVLRFRGGDIRDPDERLGWMRAEILPAWERARRQRMEWLRADAERVRRFAGVRLDELPPRRG